MNKALTLLLAIVSTVVFAQEKLDKKTKPIVAEGKLLYRSEMASWYGTDLFLEKYKSRENIGGYFSYLANDVPTCIFFSKTEQPKVIGTITFDDTYNVETAKMDMTEREFTATEKDLYEIRKLTLNEIKTDTLFKIFKDMNLNLIPIINGKEKKVYILSGPKKNGVIIFGNDYLLTFGKNNKLISKEQLHKNIIPIEYNGKDEIETTIHTHLPETGDFITATDICTLMLYEKFANWKTHNVVSKNYLNIWDCKKDELHVISMDIIEKINKNQEERNKSKDKTE
ncbi:MAG TPA: hypothetical protein PK431_09590 [Chitinophagales bacterium]|nr:hypothetical protein [Chitinophagales bacterium]